MKFKTLMLLGIAKKLLFVAVLLFSSDATAKALVSEIKGGVLTQSSSVADSQDTGQFWLQKDESGASLNGEILFNGPDWFTHIYTPRIQLGGNVSTTGETDYAYTGLYWDTDVAYDFYLAGFFGLAAHDGVIDRAPTDPRRADDRLLGSRVLFHLGPEVGYNFDNHHNLSVTWKHLSNGWMLNGFDSSGPNEGLDQVGVRYGYKF